MRRNSRKHPTQLELEILKILWQRGSGTVREVRDALEETRDLAYTSVMTTLSIMHEKRYVHRRKKTNSYVYRPALKREAATSSMVGDLVDRLFEGSASAAMLHLLETSDVDQRELQKLRELIDRKEADQS